MTSSTQMAEAQSHLMERIINLTLEIISLLTGERFPPVKSGDHVTIKVPPCPSMATQRYKERILEVTNKITELLKGEGSSSSHFMITIKEEMMEKDVDTVELGHFQGPNDLYKQAMMRDLQPILSLDETWKRPPPERSPRPLYFWDSRQESSGMHHNNQHGNPSQSMVTAQEDIKVKNENGMLGYVERGKELYQEAKMEAPPPLMSLDGAMKRNASDRSPYLMYCWDSTQEGHVIPNHDQNGNPNGANGIVIKEENSWMFESSAHRDFYTHPTMDSSRYGDPPERSLIPHYFTQEKQRPHHPGQSEDLLSIPAAERQKQEMYERGNWQSMENVGLRVNIKEEEVPTLISMDYGHKMEKSSVGGLTLPPACNIEDYSPIMSYPAESPAETSSARAKRLQRFFCSQCDRGFKSKCNLEKHELVHMAARPYQCMHCAKRFTRKEHLKRHQATHSMERPFQCSDCGKCFTHQSYLVKHLRTSVHGQNRQKTLEALLLSSPVTSAPNVHPELHGSDPSTHETAYPVPSTSISGDNIMKSGASTSTSGDDMMKSGASTSTSGDNIMKSGASTSISGDDVMKSCASTFTSGDNVVINSSTSAPSFGDNIMESGASAPSPGDKAIQSSTSTCSPGDNVMKSSAFAASPGDNVMRSSTFAFSPGDNVMVSGTSTPSPRDNVMESGASTPSPRDKVMESGDSTPSSGENMMESSASPGPGDNMIKSRASAPSPGNNVMKSVSPAPSPRDVVIKSGTSTSSTEDNVMESGTATSSSGDIETMKFSCSECDKCFTAKSSLRSHCKHHTGERPLFSCSECGKCFTAKSSLRNHWKVHTGELPFSCPECGKCFSAESFLRNHLKLHTGECPFSCPECGRCFTAKSSLRKHLKFHIGDLPFSCSECGRGFTQKSSLRYHLRIHTGERPFSCPECSKCFSWRSHLVKHQRSHIDEGPFPCSECGKSFALKSALGKHILVHKGVKPCSCYQCGECFSRKTDLVAHLNTHTVCQSSFMFEGQEMVLSEGEED